MNEPTQQQNQLTSNVARPIATEETYVVMCRTLSNGVQILEYVDRQGDGKLISAVRVDE